MVIVDNLQTAHLASKESQMPVEEVGLRVLHRVAVNGVQKPSKLPFVKKNKPTSTNLQSCAIDAFMTNEILRTSSIIVS